MERDAVIAVVRPLLEEASAFVAAWLYGSVARGEATAASDVDVALLTGAPAPRRLDDLPLDLEARLAEALGRRVQLVVVDRAPPDLVHRILRDGILLVDRDQPRRIRFEVDVRNRYFDMTPVWLRYRRGGSAA